jgi:death-on-curing protein
MLRTLDEIVAIQRDQIARYGGAEGVRDWSLLQSAAAMPAAGVGGQFLHCDLCEMAAAYLFYKGVRTCVRARAVTW